MNVISYELLRIWLEALEAAQSKDSVKFGNLLVMHDRLYKKAAHWEQGDYNFLLAANHREWVERHI